MAAETQSMILPLEEGIELDADLTVPEAARGLVVFAHGSGSNRASPRNRAVAELFQEEHLATLLIDLLTAQEQEIDDHTRHLRFDIPLLARRLVGAMDWTRNQDALQPLEIGLYGASTGAAAALIAAARRPEFVGAVVSRGGRPDLAGDMLPLVRCPVLMIVGGLDTEVLELNRQAGDRLRCPLRLAIVPGASHLFEEPGTLDRAARLAADWYCEHLLHVTVR